MPSKKRASKAVKAKPRAKKRLIKKTAPPIQEQKIEESKYFAGPAEQKFYPEKGFELPISYGDNRIVLMVRDPYWLHAYWEVNQSRLDEIMRELNDKFNSSSLVLRVYDVSDWKFFDINITERIGNWYINVGRPNASFCVDIGYLTPDGYFVCAARSNVASTPRDKMSEVIDEEWMIPDWERMYALSGGFGRGKGSMEIKEMIEKRLWMGISSPSSPIKKKDQGNK